MALSTLSVVEKALKDVFKDPIITQLDNGSGPIMAALEKDANEIEGGKIKFSLEYGRSGGVGARAEDGDLPTASPRKYEMATATTKNLYARISLTDKLIKTSKSNIAAFANQFTLQMDNILIDANDMIRRNVVGSATGVMGKITSAVGTSTTEFTLDDSVEAFYPGQYVDFGTVAGSPAVFTKSFSDYVVDVDYDNKKIVLASGHTTSANTVITLAGNYGYEMTGLDDIMNATTLYGVDRSTNGWFKPSKYDQTSSSATTDFDSMNVQRLIDTIYKRTGERPNFIACNDGVQRAYIDEQNTYKRNIEMMKVDGGYELVSYANIPITVEKYMPANTLDLINTKHIKLSRLAPWDWLSEDGAILHRITDKAAYEASLVMYGDIICMKPSANGRLVGITEV